MQLGDEEITGLIAKQLKQTRDSRDEFATAGREDLVEKADAEIEILKEYLPQQLSEEELNEIVISTTSELGASSMKDMKDIMSSIMPKVKVRDDGKLITELVKKNLQ